MVGGLLAPNRLSVSGGVSECLEFVMDITDRKHAEEALRGREASFGTRRALRESRTRSIPALCPSRLMPR